MRLFRNSSTVQISRLVGLSGMLALGLIAHSHAQSKTSASSAIIVNAGQWKHEVLACLDAGQLKIWVTSSGFLLDAPVLMPDLHAPSNSKHRLDPSLADRIGHHIVPLELRGESISTKNFVVEDTVGFANFFIGRSSNDWHPSVPVVRTIVCRDVFPGSDLRLTVHGGRPMLKLLSRESRDAISIDLSALSADSGPVARDSGIQLSTKYGEFVFQHPRVSASPVTSGAGSEAGSIADRSVSIGSGTVDFDAGGEHAASAAISFSTYLGAGNYDAIYGIAIGSDGAIYVTGNSESSDFPTANAFDPSYNAGTFGDVFITKLTPDGSGLVYSTYIGGSAADIVTGIAVDDEGNAFITGITGSSGSFPLLGAYDSTYAGGGDAFVLKLSPSGNQLLYSTFIGGAGEDYSRAIAIDGTGNAYIAGHTRSLDFPTVNGFGTDFNGGSFDAFAAKLSASGASLLYSTYLGGSADDQGFGIAVDPIGRAHVRGWTSSDDFPVTNAFDETFNGGERDVFVARLGSSGSTLEYGTYIGGSDSDYGIGIALDDSGNAYIAGVTRSDDFPLENAIDSNLAGTQDLFVTKLNGEGDALAYSTFLGGSAEDFNALAAVDGCGQLFLTAYTYSADFPMIDAFDSSFASGSDLVIAAISSDGNQLQHSSFLGGDGYDFPDGIALRNEDVYIAGATDSPNFPTIGGYSDELAGDHDGFITRISGFGVNECGCHCDCHADPACDGVRSDVIDVVNTINVAFRGATPILDPFPTCPFEDTDVDCSGATDVIDVVKTISVAFRGSPAAFEFCQPCPAQN